MEDSAMPISACPTPTTATSADETSVSPSSYEYGESAIVAQVPEAMREIMRRNSDSAEEFITTKDHD
jgi:hypothetical protein